MHASAYTQSFRSTSRSSALRAALSGICSLLHSGPDRTKPLNINELAAPPAMRGFTYGFPQASQRLVGTCKATWKAGELGEVDTDSDGVTRLERKFDSAHESENAIVDSASAQQRCYQYLGRRRGQEIAEKWAQALLNLPSTFRIGRWPPWSTGSNCGKATLLRASQVKNTIIRYILFRLETGDWRLETGDWRLETGGGVLFQKRPLAAEALRPTSQCS
jgi:hypothetical protein